MNVIVFTTNSLEFNIPINRLKKILSSVFCTMPMILMSAMSLLAMALRLFLISVHPSKSLSVILMKNFTELKICGSLSLETHMILKSNLTLSINVLLKMSSLSSLYLPCCLRTSCFSQFLSVWLLYL